MVRRIVSVVTLVCLLWSAPGLAKPQLRGIQGTEKTVGKGIIAKTATRQALEQQLKDNGFSPTQVEQSIEAFLRFGLGLTDDGGNLIKGIGQRVALYKKDKQVGYLFVTKTGQNVAQLGKKVYAVMDDGALLDFGRIAEGDLNALQGEAAEVARTFLKYKTKDLGKSELSFANGGILVLLPHSKSL